MQQRLKSWESPRKQGRNHKGKGGSARARQLKKKFSTLRQKLKEQNNNQERESQTALFFVLIYILKPIPRQYFLVRLFSYPNLMRLNG